MAAVLPLKPSLGPVQAPSCSGVCCVGASPFIVNFNLLLQDVTDFEAARRIARGVSEKGGGLRSVQAMALQHAEGRLQPSRMLCCRVVHGRCRLAVIDVLDSP
jgi:glutamate formiminotransferase